MISGLIDPSYYDDNVFTSDTTFVPQITGNYVILCVGAGASGYAGTSSQSGAGGGAGGCGYIETKLYAGTSYAITVAAANSGGVTKFGDIIQATSGTKATSITSPGTNGTCSGDGVTSVAGSSPTTGVTSKTSATKHDSFASCNYTISYLNAGSAGQIGAYPDYNFATARSSGYLTQTVYVRAKQTNPSGGSETTKSSYQQTFSSARYGAYGTYGLGGFGGSYFSGGSEWYHSYQLASVTYMYTCYARIYDSGSYVGFGSISNSTGNAGCVVVKLLSL